MRTTEMVLLSIFLKTSKLYQLIVSIHILSLAYVHCTQAKNFFSQIFPKNTSWYLQIWIFGNCFWLKLQFRKHFKFTFVSLLNLGAPLYPLGIALSILHLFKSDLVLEISALVLEILISRAEMAARSSLSSSLYLSESSRWVFRFL